MSMAENRNAGKAGARISQVNSYYGRPHRPSIWETIIDGGLQAAGSIGAAMV